MTAPTHSTFGLLLTAVVFSLFSIPILRNYPVMGMAIIGALLPDIDHPQSALGRILFFVSHPVNRRWRHRTITHSLGAWAAATGVSLPLWYYSPLYPVALSLGYLSHLLIDAVNKSGVPLFYPKLNPCVFPASDRFRITTGSWTGEGILLILLIVLLGMYVPVSNLGVWRAMRYLTASQRSAYSDYREARTRTLLDFKGTWRESKKEVKGIAPILDATRSEFLILWDGRVIPYSENGQIIPDKSRIVVTQDPIVIQERSIYDQPFSYLQHLLSPNQGGGGGEPHSSPLPPLPLFLSPSLPLSLSSPFGRWTLDVGRWTVHPVFVSGVLSSSDEFTTNLGPYAVGEFRSIEASPKRLSLRFAQPEEIRSLEIQKQVDAEEIEKLETERELLRLDIEDLKAQFPSVRMEDLRGKIEVLRAEKKERIAALQGMEDPVERMGQRDRISETEGQISAYEKELSALMLNRTSQERALELKVKEKQIRLEYKTKLWARLQDPQVLFSGKLSLRY